MMKGEILVMSERERRRCHLLQMALDGRITVKDAGELMRVSYRHAKRLKRHYDLDGARGVYYKNTLIATHPSTTFNESIRALNRKRTHTKGTQSFSWVYMASQPFTIKRGHFCSALKGTY